MARDFVTKSISATITRVITVRGTFKANMLINTLTMVMVLDKIWGRLWLII